MSNQPRSIIGDAIVASPQPQPATPPDSSSAADTSTSSIPSIASSGSTGGLSLRDKTLLLSSRLKANDTLSGGLFDISGFDVSADPEIRQLVLDGALTNTLCSRLVLRNCNLDDDFVVAYVDSLQRLARSSRRKQFLRSIDLRGNKRLTEQIVFPIVECVLHHESLERVLISDDDNEEQCQISQESRKLCADFCALQKYPAAVKHLAWDVWSSPNSAREFRRITVPPNDTVDKLTKRNREPATNIQFAVLRRDDTDPRGYTSDGVHAIVSLLEQAPDTLRTLRFERDCVRGDQSAERLAGYFCRWPSLALRELNVRNNGWTSRGLRAVLDAILGIHRQQEGVLAITGDEEVGRSRIDDEEGHERTDTELGAARALEQLQDEGEDEEAELGGELEEVDQLPSAAASTVSSSPSSLMFGATTTSHNNHNLSGSGSNLLNATTTTNNNSPSKLTRNRRLHYSNLTVLDIGDNDIDDAGVRYLTELAQTTLVNLTRVALDGNPRVSPTAAQDLFRACSINVEGATLRPALDMLDDSSLQRFVLRGGDPGIDPMSNVGFRALTLKMIDNNLSELRELAIPNHHFSVDAVRHLARFIKTHQNLITVDLRNNKGVDDECAHHLVRAMYSNNSVVSIDVRGCSITPRMEAQLEEACQLNREPVPLKHYVQLPAADPTFLKLSLRKKNPNDDPNDNSSLVVVMNKRSSFLSHHDGKKPQIDAESFKWINMVLHSQPQLTEVDLSGNDLLAETEDAFAELIAVIREDFAFARLNIANTGMDNNRAASISQSLYLNSHISQIVATGNPKLYSDGAQMLVTATTMNAMPPRFKFLYRYLVGNVAGVTEIRFDDESPGIGNEGAKILLTALAGFAGVQQHDYQERVNKLRRLEIQDAAAVSPPSNSSKAPPPPPLVLPCITHLTLTYQQLSDSIAPDLQHCLSRQSTIRHLDLSHNSFGDNSAYSLAEVISGRLESGAARSLETIDLSYNLIGDLGVFELMRGVHHHLFAPVPYPLRKVDLAHNGAVSDLDAAMKAMELRLAWSMQPREFQVMFARSLPLMLRSILTHKARMLKEQSRREEQEQREEERQRKREERLMVRQRERQERATQDILEKNNIHVRVNGSPEPFELREEDFADDGKRRRRKQKKGSADDDDEDQDNNDDGGSVGGATPTTSSSSANRREDSSERNSSTNNNNRSSSSIESSSTRSGSSPTNSDSAAGPNAAAGAGAPFETQFDLLSNPSSATPTASSLGDSFSTMGATDMQQQQRGRKSSKSHQHHHGFAWLEPELAFVGSDTLQLNEDSFDVLVGCVQEQQIHFRGTGSKVQVVRFPRHNLSIGQLRGLGALLELLKDCRTLDLGGSRFVKRETAVETTFNRDQRHYSVSPCRPDGVAALIDIAIACPHLHRINLRSEDDELLSDSEEEEAVELQEGRDVAASAKSNDMTLSGSVGFGSMTMMMMHQEQQKRRLDHGKTVFDEDALFGGTATTTTTTTTRVASRLLRRPSITTKKDVEERQKQQAATAAAAASSGQPQRVRHGGVVTVAEALEQVIDDDDEEDQQKKKSNRHRSGSRSSRRDKKRKSRSSITKKGDDAAEDDGDDSPTKRLEEEERLAQQQQQQQEEEAEVIDDEEAEKLNLLYQRLASVLEANVLLPPSARQLWVRAAVASWQQEDYKIETAKAAAAARRNRSKLAPSSNINNNNATATTNRTLRDHPVNWKQLSLGSTAAVAEAVAAATGKSSANLGAAALANNTTTAPLAAETISCEALFYLLNTLSPVPFNHSVITQFVVRENERRRLKAERERAREAKEAAERAALAAAAKAAETGEALPPEIAALAAAAQMALGGAAAADDDGDGGASSPVAATGGASCVSSPSQQPSPLSRRQRKELQKKQQQEEEERKRQEEFEASCPTQQQFCDMLFTEYHDWLSATAATDPQHQQSMQLRKLHVVDVSHLQRLTDETAVLLCIWLRCVAPLAVHHLSVPFLSSALQREAVALLVGSEEGQNIRRFSMKAEEYKFDAERYQKEMGEQAAAEEKQNQQHQQQQQKSKSVAGVEDSSSDDDDDDRHKAPPVNVIEQEVQRTTAASLLQSQRIESLEEFALLKQVHQTCERNRKGLHHASSSSAAGTAQASSRFKSVRDYVLATNKDELKPGGTRSSGMLDRSVNSSSASLNSNQQQQLRSPRMVFADSDPKTAAIFSRSTISTAAPSLVGEQVSMLRTERDDIDADADKEVGDWQAGAQQAAAEALELMEAEAAVAEKSRSYGSPTSAAAASNNNNNNSSRGNFYIVGSFTPKYKRRHRPGDEIPSWSERKKAAHERVRLQHEREIEAAAAMYNETQHRTGGKDGSDDDDREQHRQQRRFDDDDIRHRRGTMPMLTSLRRKSGGTAPGGGGSVLDIADHDDEPVAEADVAAMMEEAPKPGDAAAEAARLRRELEELELDL